MNGLDPTQDPLAQLRDIHLPAPVGWWPPAPGWWLLGGALVLLVVLALLRLYRQRQRQRYRRLALAQLRALYSRWEQHGDALDYLHNLNRLLKQTALAAYPRRDIAALNGADWLRFLDGCLRQPQFDAPHAAALAAVYQPQTQNIAPPALQRAAEYWIRRHRC
jgi:hypothetical protein